MKGRIRLEAHPTEPGETSDLKIDVKVKSWSEFRNLLEITVANLREIDDSSK